jgi:hypothetical protein
VGPWSQMQLNPSVWGWCPPASNMPATLPSYTVKSSSLVPGYIYLCTHPN